MKTFFGKSISDINPWKSLSFIILIVINTFVEVYLNHNCIVVESARAMFLPFSCLNFLKKKFFVFLLLFVGAYYFFP